MSMSMSVTVTAEFVAGALDDDEVGDDVGAGVGVDVAVGATVAVAVGVAEGAGIGAVPSEAAPTTEQVPAGMVHVEGARAPPRGAPRKPKVIEEPLASEVFQLGPAKR